VLEEPLGEHVAEDEVGLLALEGAPRRLVGDELERPEVPDAAEVADDRQLAQGLERTASGTPGSP
jgi:hypothetical protein